VAQLENLVLQVDALSKYLDGTQQLVTPEEHGIPFSIQDGLTQMDMRQPTESEMLALEHVFSTSDSPWDPKCIDNEMEIVASEDASNVSAFLEHEEQEAIDSLNVEEYVDQCLVHINLHSILQPDNNLPPDPTVTYRGPRSILPKDPDFQAIRPNFGWVNVDRVRDTLKNSTQWY
jgi:hypothetical protein